MRTWIETGQLFGYPDCCIENFIIRGVFINCNAPIPDDVKGQSIEINGVPTGFIACNYCATLPITKLVERINKRRFKHYQPFPDERPKK